MGMVARQIADAILEGREDPKEFFRRHIAKRPAPYKPPPPLHTSDPQEWDDWGDLQDWQRTAATEMFAELGDIALERYTDDAMTVAESRDTSYDVYENEQVAERYATNQVRDDLDNEPGLFTQDWLERFINMDRLREALYPDARDDDYWNEEHPDADAKLDFLIERGKLDEDDFLNPEGDRELTPEMEQAVESAFEDFIEANAREKVEDPIAFLEEFEDHEGAVKRAIDIAGYDRDAAADDAVSTDGWQHFLARYDGQSNDLPSGAVYVRV